MQPIPAEIPIPTVLNPRRIISDDREEMTLEHHRDLNRRLTHALEQSCAYGRQLWNQLQATREYLLACLPPDPRGQPTVARRGATPESQHDEDGWAAWIEAYTGVTSVLAGPAGDSGHGLSEARRTAEERRA